MSTTQEALAADIYARLVTRLLWNGALSSLEHPAKTSETDDPLVALRTAVAPGQMLRVFERNLKGDLEPIAVFARLAAQNFTTEGGDE